MRKTIFLMLMGGLSIARLNAQSLTHFYNHNHTQSTMETNPGSSFADYVVSETSKQPGCIHVTRYDHFGAIMNLGGTPEDYLLVDGTANVVNVDLVAISENEFLQVSYYNPTSSNDAWIRLCILRFSNSGGMAVIAQKLIKANDPDYFEKSLYPMDAEYDKNGFFIICGTAVKDLNIGETDPKYAFVLTTDMALTPQRLEYHNTPSDNPRDYDIATRVRTTTTGNYYVTGSQNGKPYGFSMMVVKNMLIDPATLEYTIPPTIIPGTWSEPYLPNNDFSEIGADMVELDPQDNGYFVNLSHGYYGSMINLIDPATGLSINGLFNPTLATGHSLFKVAGTNLMIHGMISNNLGQAEPVASAIDVSMNPVPVTNTQYHTAVGNSMTGSDFWTMGGIYAPTSGYYIPIFNLYTIFSNKFAANAGANADFGIIAPVHGTIPPATPYVNTKFIFTDVVGATDCSTVVDNDYKFYDFYSVPCGVDPFQAKIEFLEYTPSTQVFEAICTGTALCTPPDPHYKTTNNTSGIGEVAVNLLTRNETSVYPNPATNELKIELADSYTSNVTISLVDITGKKIADIFSGVNDHNVINYSIPDGIANGIYHLSISSKGKKTETYKVNIMR